MPLRVTIEVVPHGDESRAEVLHRATITQVRALDDYPDGLRLYRVDADGDTVVTGLAHYRVNGAVALVREALHHLVRRNPERG